MRQNSRTTRQAQRYPNRSLSRLRLAEMPLQKPLPQRTPLTRKEPRPPCLRRMCVRSCMPVSRPLQKPLPQSTPLARKEPRPPCLRRMCRRSRMPVSRPLQKPLPQSTPPAGKESRPPCLRRMSRRSRMPVGARRPPTPPKAKAKTRKRVRRSRSSSSSVSSQLPEEGRTQYLNRCLRHALRKGERRCLSCQLQHSLLVRARKLRKAEKDGHAGTMRWNVVGSVLNDVWTPQIRRHGRYLRCCFEAVRTVGNLAAEVLVSPGRLSMSCQAAPTGNTDYHGEIIGPFVITRKHRGMAAFLGQNFKKSRCVLHGCWTPWKARNKAWKESNLVEAVRRRRRPD